MRVLRCEISGQSISLIHEIAKSGEGTVWETNFPDRVAKIYHEPTDDRINKLKVMVASPPADPMHQRNHVTFAWPQDLIKDASGKPVGFIMPKVGDSVPLSTIYNPRLRSRKAPRFNWHYLHTTALNFSMAVQALHRGGYVLGDIKPQNVLVNKNALISVIDTDSFQVRDPYSRQVYRCLVGSEGFTPAELLGKELSTLDQTDVHDRFRLGVIIYLLLFGDHPFKGKWIARGESPLPAELIRYGYWPYAQRSLIKPGPNTIPLNIIHSALQAHFQACFTQGHSDPMARPTAEQWVRALRLAIADLKPCHLENNHIFDRTFGRCYWCDRKAKLGIDIFNPDLKKKIELAQQAKQKAQQAQRQQKMRSGAAAYRGRQSIPQPLTMTAGSASFVSSSTHSLSRVKQKISNLPPTLVGSLLCISSLFGLGLLLLPEVQYGTVQGLPDRLESRLRQWLRVGDNASSTAQNSVLPQELARQGLSHADVITQVSVSPNGRYVVSGSRDMNVKVWDLNSKTLVQSWTKFFEPVNFVKFSQNGKAIMSSSQSGNVVMWSFPEGKVFKTLDRSQETGGGSLLNATIDPKDEFLVSNGWSGGILIHNLRTDRLKRIETNTLASEQALLALPNSNDSLLSTSSSGQVYVWDLQTGEPKDSFPAIGDWQPIEPVRVMTSDKQGSLLVTGNWSGTINLWDVQKQVVTQSFNGHSPSYVSAMTVSPNGRWLATGGGDNLIRLWNLKAGRLAKTFKGHRDDITALDFSPNNQILISGSKDKTVRVWSVPSGENAQVLIP